MLVRDNFVIPEVFAKYSRGDEQLNLPFQLYAPAQPNTKPARGGVRGPYRRYSPEEKQAIIDRVRSV